MNDVAANGSIVIVGASLAGISAARKLRDSGFDGSITVVGDQQDPPYDRPPLSKQILSGEWTLDQTALSIEDLNVKWRLGQAAQAISVEKRTVSLADGSELGFDGLVIATGARPRTLPGFDKQGIYELRTLQDAGRIREALTSGAVRVAIIGAGFIGAEIASTAVGLGLDVNLIEADAVPFRKVLGDAVGGALSDFYRRHGVTIHAGVVVEEVIGDPAVSGLRLSDGSYIDADVVIVAIGVVPNTEWLASSGLPLDNGVVCQPDLSVVPGIVAAGDVARWHNQRLNESRRVEHWENAVKMGEHAARRLLTGDPSAFETVPWVWSDQFGVKFQFVGSTIDYDHVELIDDLAESGRLLALYRRSDVLVAACGIRRNREVLGLRKHVGLPGSWESATSRLLARPVQPLAAVQASDIKVAP